MRGRGINQDSTSLIAGTRDSATILFFDLKGFAEYARSNDPEVVMQTLNHLMADLAEELRPQEARVNQYLEDGFNLRSGWINPNGAIFQIRPKRNKTIRIARRLPERTPEKSKGVFIRSPHGLAIPG